MSEPQTWHEEEGPLMPDGELALELSRREGRALDTVGFGPPGATRSFPLDEWDPGAIWLKQLDEDAFANDRYYQADRRAEVRELPRTLILGALGELPKTPLLWRHGDKLFVFGPKNPRLTALAGVHVLHEPAAALAALTRAAHTLNPWQTRTERWLEIERAVALDCGVQLLPWLHRSAPALPVLLKRDAPAPAPARWTREPALVERARSWLHELAERDVVAPDGAQALILSALPRAELRVQRHELPQRIDFFAHLGAGAVVSGTLWRFAGEPSGAAYFEAKEKHTSAVDFDASDLRLRYTHGQQPLLVGVAT